MAKRKQEENFDDNEDELANMFDDANSTAESPPPKKRVMTPAEAWDAIQQQQAEAMKSQTPIRELEAVPTMEQITGMSQPKGGTRKMRKNGKSRKMKTKKSSKIRKRKSTQRRHKNKRVR